MGHRILLADDNEKTETALADTLEDAGYAVVQAATGKEALANLKSPTEFDLLITDLAIPDMDGLQVLTEVRRIDPGLPVVVISGAFGGRLLQFAAPFGVPILENPSKYPHS
jgi:CheY-like chemotaxis protein